MESVSTNMSSMTSEFSHELFIENIDNTSLQSFNPIETYQNLVSLPFTVRSQNNGINTRNKTQTGTLRHNFTSFSQSQSGTEKSKKSNMTKLLSTNSTKNLQSRKKEGKQNEVQKFSLDLNFSGKSIRLSSNLYEDLGRITERSKESTEPHDEDCSNKIIPIKENTESNGQSSFKENIAKLDINDDSIDILSPNFSTFRDCIEMDMQKKTDRTRSKENSGKKSYDSFKLNFWRSEEAQISMANSSKFSSKASVSSQNRRVVPILTTFGNHNTESSEQQYVSFKSSNGNSSRFRSGEGSANGGYSSNSLNYETEDSYRGAKVKLYKRIKEENQLLNMSIVSHSLTNLVL